MSFIDGIYRFIVDLNNSNSELYTRLQFKITKHPEENFAYLHKRLLTYLFLYEVGLEFSEGFFDLKQPTIWSKDLIGNLTNWIQVGLPDKKKISNAVKQHSKCNFTTVFLNEEEIYSFCHFLKGSTENWIEKVNFYLLSAEELDEFLNFDKMSHRLVANIFADTLYLINEEEITLEVKFSTVDIWNYFQKSISNL